MYVPSLMVTRAQENKETGGRNQAYHKKKEIIVALQEAIWQTGRDRQQFGLGLASLALSNPNRLSLNRFGVLKPEPNQTEAIPEPV